MRFFRLVAFSLCLVLFVILGTKLVQAAELGQCNCRSFDASKKAFSDWQKISAITQIDKCTNGGMPVTRDLGTFNTINDAINKMTSQCQGDQGQYTKCGGEVWQDSGKVAQEWSSVALSLLLPGYSLLGGSTKVYVPGQVKYICGCFDTKSECKWQSTFCCCQKGVNGNNCVQSNNFRNGAPYCGSLTFSTSPVVTQDQYTRLEVKNVNQETCLILPTVIPDQNTSKDLYKNCVWENNSCFCDKKLVDRPQEAQQNQQNVENGYMIRSVQKDGSCIFNDENQNFTIGVTDIQKAAGELDQFSLFTKGKTAQEGIRTIVGVGIKLLLSFIGSIALILYIYAGVLWMTAAGNTEQITKAKQIFMWTTLGLVMMLGSYVVVGLIFGSILQLPGVSPNV